MGIGLAMAFTVAMSISGAAFAQRPCEAPPQPVMIEGAATHIYRTVNGAELRLHIFNPPKHTASQKAAAIVFFFGGGWTFGNVEQFVPQSKYLAGRGIVAIVADYRVLCRHKSNPFDSVADAGSAIRWVRTQAAELGIDPSRIAAGGGSAGGHIALSSAIFEKLGGEENADPIRSKPNALVLFNPGIDLMSEPVQKVVRENFGVDVGNRVEQISPLQHRRQKLPPTIVLNGKADTATPFATAEKFCNEARTAGSDCRLVGYAGANHGFFNPQVEQGKWYRQTLLEVDQFLTTIGYLPGPAPTKIVE